MRQDNEEEDCNKADESDADAEIPAVPYRPDDMRALLMRSQATDGQEGPSQKRIRVRKKSAHKQALTIVENIWGNADTCSSSFNRKDSGPRHVREASSHVAYSSPFELA